MMISVKQCDLWASLCNTNELRCKSWSRATPTISVQQCNTNELRCKSNYLLQHQRSMCNTNAHCATLLMSANSNAIWHHYSCLWTAMLSDNTTHACEQQCYLTPLVLPVNSNAIWHHYSCLRTAMLSDTGSGCNDLALNWVSAWRNECQYTHNACPGQMYFDNKYSDSDSDSDSDFGRCGKPTLREKQACARYWPHGSKETLPWQISVRIPPAAR